MITLRILSSALLLVGAGMLPLNDGDDGNEGCLLPEGGLVGPVCVSIGED